MRKKPTRITKIYILNVEDPGDYYFKPEGVVFLDDLGNYTLFAADSRHNFLRTAVHKFPYQDLEEGVEHRDHHLQLNDVTLQHASRFDLVVDEMLDILHAIFNGSPRQFFFLERFFQPGKAHNHIAP
ncbi:hypothetical protein EV586_101674 [Tumebacillus sp. BK434]|uniref:hypothetical protein n=1 Tax=Tumebacillus sp. BK434 TaxID=2512169 RepID=UPI00104CD60D|nr:hypothetical protein [Tumebacillus sp. BK434]TCP59455.1 hypothetical protein EV586_101674 [Tumebacillus sp. BK434]